MDLSRGGQEEMPVSYRGDLPRSMPNFNGCVAIGQPLRLCQGCQVILTNPWPRYGNAVQTIEETKFKMLHRAIPSKTRFCLSSLIVEVPLITAGR
jgi:hypothetical protein